MWWTGGTRQASSKAVGIRVPARVLSLFLGHEPWPATHLPLAKLCGQAVQNFIRSPSDHRSKLVLKLVTIILTACSRAVQAAYYFRWGCAKLCSSSKQIPASPGQSLVDTFMIRVEIDSSANIRYMKKLSESGRNRCAVGLLLWYSASRTPISDKGRTSSAGIAPSSSALAAFAVLRRLTAQSAYAAMVTHHHHEPLSRSRRVQAVASCCSSAFKGVAPGAVARRMSPR